ncbi:MAG: ECF transporter S component [Chloroflexi bacterium]|nr:ECF transporter S component [Chloroflexota bacterium]MCI0643418.1 ECF transporter S component [Chloroflexota bacterium]MCI0731036.1 ECF transporter S component [Chloroflexota bacterium]
MKHLLTVAIYGLSALIGLVAFAYPFFLPQLAQVSAATADESGFRLADAPLLTAVLLALCLVVLLLEVQGQAINAKIVAALGLLSASTAVLRLLEAAIPGPGGFSLMFAPIILAGYVFGARFGFLMGTMALLVSALITGGVGPWLPYQMFTAGWVGLTAGWLPHLPPGRPALAMLAAFGFGWGLLFGAIMNLFFWPFVIGDSATSWRPGAGLGEALARYGAFYLATSLWWDLARSAGNVVLLLALGEPVIRALARFRYRFQYEVIG